MTALADPFSRVHPFFWPVLWLSLRSFVAWTGRLIEDGHGYAAMRVEITWYGWIHVVYLDLSPERAAFNRHMAGVEDEGWRGVLTRAGREVTALLTGDSSPACRQGAGRGEGASPMSRRSNFRADRPAPTILDTS